VVEEVTCSACNSRVGGFGTQRTLATKCARTTCVTELNLRSVTAHSGQWPIWVTYLNARWACHSVHCLQRKTTVNRLCSSYSLLQGVVSRVTESTADLLPGRALIIISSRRTIQQWVCKPYSCSVHKHSTTVSYLRYAKISFLNTFSEQFSSATD